MPPSIQHKILIARTIPLLGISNIVRVADYRLRKSLNIIHFRQEGPRPEGPFFAPASNGESASAFLSQTLFGWDSRHFVSPPDWLANPFEPACRLHAGSDWRNSLAELPTEADVKDFWELSRWYWVPELAWRAREGDGTALSTLNQWLDDWVMTNPSYKGIQWSCGQEAAIRLLNLALASLILGGVQNTAPALLWLVKIHVNRIEPTLGYAIGQQNNHGSTEAAALYIGGSWLAIHNQLTYSKTSKKGRHWLLDRADFLIQPDGTSNQYSTTYHRANLEVFSLAEYWRLQMKLTKFPSAFYTRMKQGTQWLHQLTNPVTGDAPNFGPNDGSHLFSVTRSPYRDFRPTVAWATALFEGTNAYPSSTDFENRAALFNIATSGTELPPPESAHYPDGGHMVLRQGPAAVFFRYPAFRFRPGHADCLHTDLRIGNRMLFRDGGTYRYTDRLHHLSEAQRHNTVTFDDSDQMPKLGQFLYGSWPKAEKSWLNLSDPSQCEARAGYKDHKGNQHLRELVLTPHEFLCVDHMSGAARKATLRWRLDSADWRLEGNTITDEKIRVEIECNQPLSQIRLVPSSESLYYRQLTPCLLLEVDVCQLPATFKTRVIF